jgi:hypothetical protein
MKTWTVDKMLAEGPCYGREQLLELAAGRERMSLLEIVLDSRISDADAIWCATRPGALRRGQVLEWIGWVVDAAVSRHALHCGVASVEAWAARWLSGEPGARAAAAARTAGGAAVLAAEAAAAGVWAARTAEAAVWAARAAEAAAEAAVWARTAGAAGAARADAMAGAAADAAVSARTAGAAARAARTEQRALLLGVL